MRNREGDRFSSDDQLRGAWEAREYRQTTGRPVVTLYPGSEQWSYTGRKRPRQERPSAPLVAATPRPPVVAVTHWGDTWEGMDAARAEWEAERLTRKLTCKHDQIQDVPAIATLGQSWKRRAYGGLHGGTHYIRYGVRCECGQDFQVTDHYRDGNRIMLRFGPS